MDVVAIVHVPKVKDARNLVITVLISLHKHIEVIEVTVINALKEINKTLHLIKNTIFTSKSRLNESETNV